MKRAGMAEDGRNPRMNKRGMENRKRKRLMRWLSLWGRVLVFIVILICIRNIYDRLEEVGTELERLGTAEYGAVVPAADAQPVTKTDTANYAGSLDSWDVGKPMERTEAEVLSRLGELGQNSPLIETIKQNHSQYPKELLAALANNPEMADFAAGYPGEKTVTGGLTASEKEQKYPLFLQWDPRWGYASYGESCIGLAGCGPTCLAMALFYLTGDETITPDRIAAYSMENGYYVSGTGTAWALMEDAAELYGAKAQTISLSENNMRAALDGGGIIICAMRKGNFTTSGHYIVIYGYDSEGFLVNDPNCVARSSRKWTYSEIEYQIKNIWAYTRGGGR